MTTADSSSTQPGAAIREAFHSERPLPAEVFEMLGMAMFNYALLDHLRTRFGRLTFSLS